VEDGEASSTAACQIGAVPGGRLRAGRSMRFLALRLVPWGRAQRNPAALRKAAWI